MTTEIDRELSLLIDGELDKQHQEHLLDTIARDEALKQQYLRLNFMRLAVRGQISTADLQESFQSENSFDAVIGESRARQPQRHPGKLALLRDFFFPRFGGFRWAAAATVALAIGYFSHDLVEQQVFNPTGTNHQEFPSSSYTWQFSSGNGSPRIENYLNQSLLGLGDISGVLNVNGKTNALLVNYTPQGQ